MSRHLRSRTAMPALVCAGSLALWTATRAEPRQGPVEEPVLGGACPAAAGQWEADIAAQASARVPLRAGLTMATAWHRTTEADEIECVTQVTGVGPSAITTTAGCALRDGTVTGSRRLCHADLLGAYIYSTGAGDDPDLLRGTTMFSLSSAAFRELKQKRTTRHRNVTTGDDGGFLADLRGTLEFETTGTLAAIVNDEVVELPVIRAHGRLQGQAMGKPVETRVSAAVVDDERFPLVLDYRMPDVGASGFQVRYTRISFPTDGRIERRLAVDSRVDVYGVYFDFASHQIRPESEPVLREIAEALNRHPEWTLTINGHTDGVGDARANQVLSERRSAAVRAALVDRYSVAPGRLTARGYGASAPKDTNQTREGRARNRRVELVRQ